MNKEIIAALLLFLAACAVQQETVLVQDKDLVEVPDIDVSSDHYAVMIRAGGSSAARGTDGQTYFEVKNGTALSGNSSFKYFSPEFSYKCTGTYSIEGLDADSCRKFKCEGNASNHSTRCERRTLEENLLEKLKNEQRDLTEINQAIEQQETVCIELPEVPGQHPATMCIKEGKIVLYDLHGFRQYYLWERIPIKQ